MTPQYKIFSLAELDGYGQCSHDFRTQPSYLTSYDAIIPLIQKQKQAVKSQIKWLIVFNDGGVAETIFDATPTQLADALLIATGKMKD